jgi:hypothetical protein
MKPSHIVMPCDLVTRKNHKHDVRQFLQKKTSQNEQPQRESSKRELRVWGFENAKKSKNLTLASFRSE